MLRIFSYAYWPSVCLFWRNVYLGLLPTFFCLFVCFAVSVPIRFYSLYIPKEKKGKGKGSANMLQNDSKWERKYLAQQNQPSNKHCPDGGRQGPGVYVSCSSGMRRDEGKNRWVHAFLPSLPINSRFHTKLWFLAVNMELHSPICY